MAKISKILILVLIIAGIILGFALEKAAAQSDLPFLVKEKKPLKVPRPLYVPDEIIVKFKPGIAGSLVKKFLKEQEILEKSESKFGKFKVLKIPKGRVVSELVEIFRVSPLVEYAEPNFYAYATMVPNDPYYQYQWHFDNLEYGGIQMEQAWDKTTGDPNVVVAVVDTGVAYEDYPAPDHWHIDTYKAYGGSGHSWWCGMFNPDWPNSPGYGNGWKDYLQHSFDLTTATGTVTLTYQRKYDMERNYDYAYVEVSDNNGLSWSTLKSYTGSSGWKSDSISLTSYKGKNILLRFRFNSDESVSDEDGHLYIPKFNSDGAIYVDEIKITDGSGTLFYDNVESGPGTWETTKYKKAPDLASTPFWVNSGEAAGDGIDNDDNGYIDDINGWDFINSDAHPNDDEAHGTHVTGTIAQTTDNSLGVAGIAFNTTIMPVKVLDAAGSGTYNQVADGIYYAVNNGAKVISMSLGGSSPSTTLENAVASAYNNGVTVIAASGNSNASSCDYPAAYDDYVIAVGATQYDETKAPYSNYGSSLDIVAPGGNTAVDQNNDGYVDGVLQNTFGDTPVDWSYWFYQGTSMATPHVSGVAALLLAANPTLTPDAIRNALESTAEDLGAAGRDDTYGWGLVDAFAALTSLTNLSISIIPTSWGIGPVTEGQLSQSGLFTVKNDGSVIETFTLGIEGPSSPSGWITGSLPGDDTYVMKGLFGPTSGNPTGLFSSDDIIGMGAPSATTTTQFGDLSLIPNGVSVEVNGERGLWFEFQAPTSTSSGGQEQSITITVGAQEPS